MPFRNTAAVAPGCQLAARFVPVVVWLVEEMSTFVGTSLYRRTFWTSFGFDLLSVHTGSCRRGSARDGPKVKKTVHPRRHEAQGLRGLEGSVVNYASLDTRLHLFTHL